MQHVLTRYPSLSAVLMNDVDDIAAFPFDLDLARVVRPERDNISAVALDLRKVVALNRQVSHQSFTPCKRGHIGVSLIMEHSVQAVMTRTLPAPWLQSLKDWQRKRCHRVREHPYTGHDNHRVHRQMLRNLNASGGGFTPEPTQHPTRRVVVGAPLLRARFGFEQAQKTHD